MVGLWQYGVPAVGPFFITGPAGDYAMRFGLRHSVQETSSRSSDTSSQIISSTDYTGDKLNDELNGELDALEGRGRLVLIDTTFLNALNP